MNMLDGATALTLILLLPESAGRGRELSSRDMPVLSEDSGEYLSWAGPAGSPGEKSLPQQPQAGRKQDAAYISSQGLPCPKALGMREPGERMSTRQGPLGVPQGQEVPMALAKLHVSYPLLRFA